MAERDGSSPADTAEETGIESAIVKSGRCGSAAKQAPHRPGLAPALGLRAGMMASHCIADRSPHPTLSPKGRGQSEGLQETFTMWFPSLFLAETKRRAPPDTIPKPCPAQAVVRAPTGMPRRPDPP